MKKDVKHRQSGYNSQRSSYLSLDGKYYCYKYLDPETQAVTVLKLEVGKDVTTDITFELDKSDHNMDLNDRYQNELRDALFNTQTEDQDGASTVYAYDKLDSIPAIGASPEDILFPAVQTENPLIERLHQIIDEVLTPEQRELLFAIYGEGLQIEEYRQIIVKRTGREITRQAMNNRKNKMLNRVKKALGENLDKSEK